MKEKKLNKRLLRTAALLISLVNHRIFDAAPGNNESQFVWMRILSSPCWRWAKKSPWHKIRNKNLPSIFAPHICDHVNIFGNNLVDYRLGTSRSFPMNIIFRGILQLFICSSSLAPGAFRFSRFQCECTSLRMSEQWHLLAVHDN